MMNASDPAEMRFIEASLELGWRGEMLRTFFSFVIDRMAEPFCMSFDNLREAGYVKTFAGPGPLKLSLIKTICIFAEPRSVKGFEISVLIMAEEDLFFRLSVRQPLTLPGVQLAYAIEFFQLQPFERWFDPRIPESLPFTSVFLVPDDLAQC